MKRAVSLGGAGISARLTPEETVQKLFETNEKRQQAEIRRSDVSTKSKLSQDFYPEVIEHVSPFAEQQLREQMAISRFCNVACLDSSTLRCNFKNRESVLKVQVLSGERRLICTCPYSKQYLLPCCHVLKVKQHIDLQDIHCRWLKVYWRGDYTPIKKHDNFIGVVMNERIEAILQEGRSSLMDVGFLALDEADPPDTIETPAPLPKHDYFSEVMRKVKALITTADTGNQRRDALMRMLDEAQLQLDEMPIDIATRPIPRHKASYERN